MVVFPDIFWNCFNQPKNVKFLRHCGTKKIWKICFHFEILAWLFFLFYIRAQYDRLELRINKFRRSTRFAIFFPQLGTETPAFETTHLFFYQTSIFWLRDIQVAYAKRIVLSVIARQLFITKQGRLWWNFLDRRMHQTSTFWWRDVPVAYVRSRCRAKFRSWWYPYCCIKIDWVRRKNVCK